MGGISRNDVKRAMGRIFRVRSWKLLLVLVPLGFFAATMLRLDHLEMVRLRDEVLAADESGDGAALSEGMARLREFTATHIIMNMAERNGMGSIEYGTGVFYLEHSYERDAQAALRAAEAQAVNDNNPNGNVFKKATDYCDPLAKQYGWGYSKPYFDCIMGELAKYPSMGEISDARVALIPPTGEYRVDLASPVWYPCLAGWMVLACLLMSVVIIIRFLIWVALKITLLLMKRG